jgi:hypothetical protein
LLLNEQGHGAAGLRGDSGQQTRLSEGAVQGASPLAAAADLAAGETLDAACCAAGFVTPGFDIAFRSRFENAHTGADNALPFISLFFEKSPSDRTGANIQTKHERHEELPD